MCVKTWVLSLLFNILNPCAMHNMHALIHPIRLFCNIVSRSTGELWPLYLTTSSTERWQEYRDIPSRLTKILLTPLPLPANHYTLCSRTLSLSVLLLPNVLFQQAKLGEWVLVKKKYVVILLKKVTMLPLFDNNFLVNVAFLKRPI